MLQGKRLWTVEMCEQALDSGQMGDGSDWDPEVAAVLIIDDATWDQRAVMQGRPVTLSWNTYNADTVWAVTELRRRSYAPLLQGSMDPLIFVSGAGSELACDETNPPLGVLQGELNTLHVKDRTPAAACDRSVTSCRLAIHSTNSRNSRCPGSDDRESAEIILTSHTPAAVLVGEHAGDSNTAIAQAADARCLVLEEHQIFIESELSTLPSSTYPSDSDDRGYCSGTDWHGDSCAGSCSVCVNNDNLSTSLYVPAYTPREMLCRLQRTVG